MDENQTEDLLNELAITEAADKAVGELLAVIGFLAVEIIAHTTPEGLAESCARNTGIDQEFTEALLSDCRNEYFKRLTSKKP